jgi:proteasome accessory factor A
MTPPIVMGTETEFFIARQERDRLVEVDQHTLAALMLQLADLFARRVTQHQRVQLMNGAVVYIDEGHLEYATPPCSTWSDVALHEADMHAVMSEALARYQANSGDELVVLPPGTGIARELCGYHENYGLAHHDYFRLFTSANMRPAPVWMRVLVPYLVTRIIVCGSGGLTEDGYVMSPRASAVTHTFHASTFPERPIVHLRRPRLQDEFLRVHITCGDPNQRMWPTYTRLATTANVLLAAARGLLDHLDFTLADPVAAMRNLSAALDPRFRLSLRDGDAEAVDILQTIVTAASELDINDNPPSSGVHTVDVFSYWKRTN